jgi:hypothetical protein
MAERFIEKLRRLWSRAKSRYELLTTPFDPRVILENSIPIEVNDTGEKHTGVVLSDWEPIEAYWATGNSSDEALENARALAIPMIEHATEVAHRITEESGKATPIKYHMATYSWRAGPFK